MKAAIPRLIPFALTMLASQQVLAHHSAAAFDTSTEITISGTIIEYSFRNPHVYMTLEVKQDDGTVVETEVEAGAGSVISPLGFTRDAVSIGDVVNIVGNPGRRDPQGLLLGRELYKQDGSYYPLNISSRSVYEESDAVAETIAGTWFAPRSSFFAILGAARNWPLTDKGREAAAASGGQPTPQKDCIPLGEPALLFYPVATTVTVHEDRVEFLIDWLDSERTVWLDGREHPPASETFRHGHSVGHWDGDALVVDSTNFSYNPIGLSTSVPSSEAKHLQERFELSEDGTQLVYSGTLEDPEYLSEAVQWSGNWLYRPGMQHSNERCDQEVAKRFLDD